MKAPYTEIAGVVYTWLLHHDQYVWKCYSECYNKECQVHNLENYITKVFFKLILKNFSS